jgi:uncharacterized protein YdeI (YjbR/CyaY-like superfamily)
VADATIETGSPFEPIFFERPQELRAWLEAHHETAPELFVGGWKKDTGRPSVTWQQLVDEALCFGWIDGIRRSLPDGGWSQRLTPRRRGSNWSAINVANVERLRAEGRMRPAGEAAFALRVPERTGIYSYERRNEATFAPEEEARFRAHPAAWSWFLSKTAKQRAYATWWVVSAKRADTRERRLTTLIEAAAEGRMPERLVPPGRSSEGRPSR